MSINALRQQRRRNRLRQEGRCHQCGKAKEAAFTRCAACRERGSIRGRIRKCLICSRPFLPLAREMTCGGLLCEVKAKALQLKVAGA